MLSARELEANGKEVTKLRAKINEKAKMCYQDDEVPPDDLHAQRAQMQLSASTESCLSGNSGGRGGRKGMKYSTAADNPEGLQEKELRERYQLEKPAGRRYKHRRRCQLSSNEIEEIVASYDEGKQT